MAFRSVRMLPAAFQRSTTTEAAGRTKAFGTNNKRVALGEIGNKQLQHTKKSGKSNQLKKFEVKEEPSMDAMDMEDDALVDLPAGVTDIDELDASDPQLVADYVTEIHTYMHQLEVEQGVRSEYMKGIQQEVTPNMRSILIDWLVEVQVRFKLIPETMQLTVNVLDRYLSIERIAKSKLQLVGIVAMLIASKYEEMWPPEVRDFMWVADNAYSRAEIISMEQKMLRVLDYSFGTPLPLHFLQRCVKASGADSQTQKLGEYILELSTVNYELASMKPSIKAAAALNAANQIVAGKPTEWSAQLQHYSMYTADDFAEATVHMNKMLKGSEKSKHQAVRHKWSKTKTYNAISTIPELSSFIAQL